MDKPAKPSEKFTFSKGERLCELKQIENIFATGQSFSLFPFRIIYINTNNDSNYPVRILLSVSKKTFKNAVDRNNIKRKMREAYRKNKHILYSEIKHPTSIVILYISKDKNPDYTFIEIKIKQIINELINKLLNKPDNSKNN